MDRYQVESVKRGSLHGLCDSTVHNPKQSIEAPLTFFRFGKEVGKLSTAVPKPTAGIGSHKFSSRLFSDVAGVGHFSLMGLPRSC